MLLKKALHYLTEHGLGSSLWLAFQFFYLTWGFLIDPIWKRYHIGFLKRVQICGILLNRTTNPPASMLYVTEILKYPAELGGDVIECGVWKGGMTIGLSIACKIANRRLLVCDSFQGLPDPLDTDRRHRSIMMPRYPRESQQIEDDVRVYHKGEYLGTREEVEQNVSRWGEISVCRFVPGWFNESLPEAFTDGQKFVFAVIDVDLSQSMRDCLLSIWPRLQPGSKFYTDDGGELDIAAIFFERDWWKKNLGENPPGLIGAGFGISFFQGQYSSIGLAIKGHHLLSNELTEILYTGEQKG